MTKRIVLEPPVTVAEAARLLALSKNTIYRLVDAGKLKRTGTPQYRIPMSEVRRLARPVIHRKESA